MELLSGEAKLSEANDGTVVLTTHRVRIDQGPGRRSQFVSITLDQVASCSLGTRSYPFLLLFAVLFALAGFQMAGERPATVGFGIGAALALACILLYLITREQLITISSSGESIRVRTRGLRRAACVQFVDDLERAKLHLTTPGVLPSPGRGAA